MSQDDDDYDVGYGKPPKDTQFTKGRSGNPKGRPKGAKGFNASLKRELETVVVAREGDRTVKMSKAAAAAKRLVERALKGDMTALRLIVAFDRDIAALVENMTPEVCSGIAPDKTDDAVLAHFVTRIKEGLNGPEDEEANS